MTTQPPSATTMTRRPPKRPELRWIRAAAAAEALLTRQAHPTNPSRRSPPASRSCSANWTRQSPPEPSRSHPSAAAQPAATPACRLSFPEPDAHRPGRRHSRPSRSLSPSYATGRFNAGTRPAATDAYRAPSLVLSTRRSRPDWPSSTSRRRAGASIAAIDAADQSRDDTPSDAGHPHRRDRTCSHLGRMRARLPLALVQVVIGSRASRYLDNWTRQSDPCDRVARHAAILVLHPAHDRPCGCGPVFALRWRASCLPADQIGRLGGRRVIVVRWAASLVIGGVVTSGRPVTRGRAGRLSARR